jgi:F0F1-type ATP synthase assembly protein I
MQSQTLESKRQVQSMFAALGLRYLAAVVAVLCLPSALTFAQTPPNPNNNRFREMSTTAVQPATRTRDLSRELDVPVERLQSTNAKFLQAGSVVAANDIVAAAKPNIVLAERIGQKVRTVAADPGGGNNSAGLAFALPINFRALATAPGQSVPAPVDFEAVVLILGALQFSGQDNSFVGELAVALRNRSVPNDRSVLVEPIKLLISAEGAKNIAPQNFEIKRLNDPVSVKILASEPVDPFKVTARTLIDDGDTIEMPISRPKMTISVASDSINGLGLAKTAVNIQAIGLENADKHSITLSTDRGDVTSVPIQFGANGFATGEIRSDGIGVAKIRAVGAPLQSVETEIRFTLPWKFAIAVVLGAIVGWFVRTRGRSKSVRSALIKIGSGLIVAAAYMIGIRWAEWAPDAKIGEALAFFLGAAGAYTELRVLFPKAKG